MIISNNMHTVQNTAVYVSQVSGCCEHTKLVLISFNSSAAHLSALLTDTALSFNFQCIK